MASTAKLSIRPGRKSDVEQAAELVVRLKRLNGEFDPLFNVSGKALEAAKKYLEDAIRSDEHQVIVATLGERIVGLVKADIRRRLFYEPKIEGAIIEFYVLPEARRKNLGEQLIDSAIKKLKEKGAEIITAEFPSQNMIAVNFYEKLGFRRLVSIYGTSPAT